MPRLLFEKTGNAIWISHLDLMRVFQRAFKRAKLPLKHTQGFNPRPSVSIALPLSVGISSCCELLDFDLEGQAVSCEEVKSKLNSTLIDGIRVISVYDSGSKLGKLSYLKCQLVLEYDNEIDDGLIARVSQLFLSNEIMVDKRGKNGIISQNIIPMIKDISVSAKSHFEVMILATVCCQNPTLNPMQIVNAISTYLPEDIPSFSNCCRLELLDDKFQVFR